MRVPQRIAISGSSGLIGTALVGHLKSEGHTVQRLVRRAPVAADEVQWDPKSGFVDLAPLAGVDAIIHLAGVGVGDKRWSKKYKSEILNSRLLGTTTIAKAVAELKPQVFISASAIGWYGESGNRAVVETDRVGDDFLAAVCREHDQIRAIVFALENPISGPVNVTSPNPVTNQEFTSALARALHRPALFPAPAIALKIALGGFSSEVLGSKKVIPHVLTEAGFTWDYPHITEALNQLVQD